VLQTLCCALYASGTSAGLLDTNDPGLKQIVSSVAFHVSFDDQTCDADLSKGDNRAMVNGTPVFIEGVSGKAVKRVNLRYPTEKNLDLDKPGSLAMWVFRTSNLEPHPEGLAGSWWMTEYSGNGYIGFEPRGEKTGMFWAHYFKNLANQSGTFTCDWKFDQWQLLLITWRGPRWTVIVDGKTVSDGSLPRAIKQAEIAPRFMIGAAAVAVDEFTIFKHPLTDEEIKLLMKAARH